MNNLEQWLQDNGQDETLVMNVLQEHGRIISDNCVKAKDVDQDDISGAIEFLKKYHLTNP